MYVTDNPPWPTDYGGAQRSALIQRALRSCGEVELLLTVPPERVDAELESMLRRDWNLAAVVNPLRRSMRWPWRAMRPLNPRLAGMLAHHLGHQAVYYQPDPLVAPWVRRQHAQKPFDLVLGRFLRITAQSGAFDLLPVIVDADDLDSVVYRSRREAGARGPIHDWALRRQLGQVASIETATLARAAHVFVASDRDRELIGHDRVSTLPNIPYPPELADATPVADSPDSKVVLLVASLGHRPNIRGLEWFLDHVWAEVRRLKPDAVFRIAGGGMSPEMKQRCAATPGVEALGRVEDLGAAYAAAAVTVSPINDGAGTKIKVVEAMLHGRVCVATPHSWRGYEATLPRGEAIAVEEEPLAFARAVVGLLNDFSARSAMARRAGEQVRAHYIFPRIERSVHEAVERVLREGHRGGLAGSPAARQPLRAG